jgi:hypothetical protein
MRDRAAELRRLAKFNPEIRDQVAEIRRAREADLAKHDAIAAEIAEIAGAAAIDQKGE